MDALPRLDNRTAEGGTRNTLQMMAQNSLEKLKPIKGNYMNYNSANPKAQLNTQKKPRVLPGYMPYDEQRAHTSMEVVGTMKRRSIS